MTRYPLTLFFVLLITARAWSQCAVSEQKVFNSPNTYFHLQASAISKSGQLIGAGGAYQPSFRAALAGFDAANNAISWLKTYEDFMVIKMGITDNNDIVMAGHKISDGNVQTIILVRADPLGNLRWVKRLRSTSLIVTDPLYSVSISAVIGTSDGGVAISGTNVYYSGTFSSFIGFVIKVDAAGTISWAHEYRETDLRALTQKGNFLYAAGNFFQGSQHAGLCKLELSTGNVISCIGYSLIGIGANYFRNLHATDYGFLAAMQSYTAGKHGYYVVKLDHDGRVITQKQFAFDGPAVLNPFYDVRPTSDGGCLAWHSDISGLLLLNEARLYKLDNQLQPQWKKNYPSPGTYADALIHLAWEQNSKFKAIGLSADPATGTSTGYPRLFNIEADGTLNTCLSQNTILDIKDSLQCIAVNLTPTVKAPLQFTAPLTTTVVVKTITHNEVLLCNTGCSIQGLKASGDTILCKNSFTELSVSRIGNCALNMQWTTDPGFANITPVNDTTVRLNLLGNGYGTVKVKWAGACGSLEKSITIYYNPLQNVPTLGNDTSLCTGDKLLLQLPQTYPSIQWSDQSSGSQMTVADKGAYWVKVSQDNICFATDTIKITALHPLPSLNIHKETRVCLPDPLLLQPGNFVSYLWQDGSAASTYPVTATGTYWVQVTDNHQCKAADTVDILTIGSKPVDFVSFTDSSICKGQYTLLTTRSSFSSYNWNNGASSAAGYGITQPGLYTVTVTGKDGCTGKDSILLVNKGCETSVVFPNAFAPNGMNKRFRAIFPGSVPESFHLVVFSRWGQRIFETRDPYKAWDGKLGNQDQGNGSYPWVCTYTFDGQPSQQVKGIVSLFR